MDRSRLGSLPTGLRRRAGLVSLLVVLAIAGVLGVAIVVIEGVRPEPWAWVVIGIVGAVLAVAIVVGVRSFSAEDRTALAASKRQVLEPHDVADPFGIDADIDLVDIDLTRGPVVRIELHPGPLMRRRLVDRPDALELVADGDGLDVPGWLVEGRSRVIERADRVEIPWSSVARFRVRADRDGPDFYDITAKPDAGGPGRWRVRRAEIDDEVGLLDHIRRVGRITIELEDSIRST